MEGREGPSELVALLAAMNMHRLVSGGIPGGGVQGSCKNERLLSEAGQHAGGEGVLRSKSDKG